MLQDPAHVAAEYQRRLEVLRTGPRRLELETVARQLAKLRAGIGRLIDSYAEGVISKAEFEPRLAGLRRRVAKLEAEATGLQDATEQARSLQLVIGKLELFAALVRDRLDEANQDTKRDIVRTLVRRVEIGEHHVRVIFRVDPGPQQGGSNARRIAQHCPERHRLVAVRDPRRGAGGRGHEARVLTGPQGRA